MKYGPEKTKEICTLLEQGNDRNDAFLLADINQDTFYEWMKKPEFSEAIKKAELKCKSFHINNIKKASEKSWQASAWYLERRFPERWGLKSRIDEKQTDADALRLASKTIELMKQLNANGNLQPAIA